MSALEKFQCLAYCLGLFVIGMLALYVIYLLIRIVLAVLEAILMLIDIWFSK